MPNCFADCRSIALAAALTGLPAFAADWDRSVPAPATGSGTVSPWSHAYGLAPPPAPPPPPPPPAFSTLAPPKPPEGPRWIFRDSVEGDMPSALDPKVYVFRDEVKKRREAEKARQPTASPWPGHASAVTPAWTPPSPPPAPSDPYGAAGGQPPPANPWGSMNGYPATYPYGPMPTDGYTLDPIHDPLLNPFSSMPY